VPRVQGLVVARLGQEYYGTSQWILVGYGGRASTAVVQARFGFGGRAAIAVFQAMSSFQTRHRFGGRASTAVFQILCENSGKL